MVYKPKRYWWCSWWIPTTCVKFELNCDNIELGVESTFEI